LTFLPKAGKQPLSGIRVLDFTWVWAGLYCTLQQAHMGAEVIRVETTKRGLSLATGGAVP